jgi:alpha-N-acetylglucosamine transferase
MKYAYVNLIYGNNNEVFLNTLIFVISLKKTHPKYKIILCYTNDLSINKINILKKYYDELILIEYLNIEGIQKERFINIFTKLKIFELTQFHKILFLDTDMYVLKNLDHIFQIKTPAGMIINSNLDIKHNEKINKSSFTINAGFMLLSPSKDTYNQMVKSLDNFDVSEGDLEQEFLSKFLKSWTNISYLYNFQFGLIYIKNKRSEIYKNTKINEIFVIHYSAKKKAYHYMNTKSETYYNFKNFYDKWILQFKKARKYYSEKGIDIENI